MNHQNNNHHFGLLSSPRISNKKRETAREQQNLRGKKIPNLMLPSLLAQPEIFTSTNCTAAITSFSTHPPPPLSRIFFDKWVHNAPSQKMTNVKRLLVLRKLLNLFMIILDNPREGDRQPWMPMLGTAATRGKRSIPTIRAVNNIAYVSSPIL